MKQLEKYSSYIQNKHSKCSKSLKNKVFNEIIILRKKFHQKPRHKQQKIYKTLIRRTIIMMKNNDPVKFMNLLKCFGTFGYVSE